MKALALALTIALTASVHAAERPRIDVVFVIDTTGSMQPYIDAVKKKVWDIANELLKGKPTPIVRLGVVAYRDRTDSWITQHIDLTDDIDKVHRYLMELKADGGGDTPEHATAGLRDALEKISWSTGPRVLKAMYLVGDAPAHADYPDGDYKPVAKAAVAKGINIHTIACKGAAEVPQWKEIAKLSDGQFIQMPTALLARARPGRLAGSRSKGPAEAEALAESGDAAAAPLPPGAPAAGAAPAAAPAMDESMGESITKTLKDEAKKRGVADY